ncbi:hypothetical protein F1880_010055 [Penicillium rolfsii]|nr:hypothetical protein F1880_010055 [Penicillium rolfsii]
MADAPDEPATTGLALLCVSMQDTVGECLPAKSVGCGIVVACGGDTSSPVSAEAANSARAEAIGSWVQRGGIDNEEDKLRSILKGQESFMGEDG